MSKISVLKKRKRKHKIYKFIKYFSFGALAACCAILIILAAVFLNLKKVFQNSAVGKENLELSVQFIKEQDFSAAAYYADKSGGLFKAAATEMQKFRGNLIISKTPFLQSQTADIESLLASAEIISRAMKEGADFGQKLKVLSGGKQKINFSNLSKEEKKKILARIYESSAELAGMKANFDLALIKISEIKCNGLLWPAKGKIDNIKVQLAQAHNFLKEAIPLSQILPLLAGYPGKASYLVMLQNNGELRPTGGFLGTYGIVEIEYGDILRFDTHDIYHLDMPVKDKINIEPPESLQKYMGLKRWYLRDANWSPDWPVAARKIEWFFKQEDKLLPKKDQINNFKDEFDGIAAITPDFIINLLKITGPIKVGGEEYNERNFIDLLEYKVERGYIQLGVPSWHRKEVIGDIAKELKIKLFNLPPSRWNEIRNALTDSIVKKDILIYSKNAVLQEMIKDQGWAGEVKAVENSDYLMIVDANMASLKTDNVIDRSVSYKMEQSASGLFAKLKIKYAHNGNYDWKTSDYKTYTRVYVPLGSVLIKAEGAADSVKTKNELGKTSFETLISVKVGEISEFYLEYKLPENLFKLSKKGAYEFYLQKQPGNKASELTVDLNFANIVKSYSPRGFYVEEIGNKRIRWESDLSMDKVFRVNF